MKLSYKVGKLRNTLYCLSCSNPMLRKAVFFRVMAIPACMVWGVYEFLALQRTRLQGRRKHS